MALLQILASLWPLFKEFFKGKQLEDDEDKGKGSKNQPFIITLVDKVQKSRRAVITIIGALAVSLFLNYKMINKLIVLTREEKSQSTSGAVNNIKNPPPTIPRPKAEDVDVVSRTVMSLQEIYEEQ